MNKKLMAVAVAGALAIPGMAFAQSSATLFGTIDLSLRNQSKVNDGAGGTSSVTDVASQDRTSNRWGIKGSEDLGGGLKANFHLEAGYNSADGSHSTGSWDRGSWLGLSSGGNSVELGYDYTTNFKVVGKYDPMSYTYTGIAPAVAFTSGVRAHNMVQGAVNFNGVTLMADYAFGTAVPGNSSANRHTAIGGYWSGNGLTIGAAAGTNNDPTNAGSRKDATIGAAYNMNQFTFRAGYATVKYDAGYASAPYEKNRLVMLGVQYAFSDRVSGRLGYYDQKITNVDGKAKTTMLAVDYSLSKATTAYAELDHRSFSGSAVPAVAQGSLADGATGIAAGIVHAF